MLTGAVHTFIGIRVRWVHASLSGAYVGCLGITLLLLYVTALPISNAIQGAYVAAAGGTGLVLGTVAGLFKESTECVGGLVGGFCLAMWILTLKEGGLILQTAGKVILITALTLGSFAFYFSRWTRYYALIICIAFSGATAVVMGIDMFSRAGLKEFWAYIWNLNDKLFPVGVDTYPVTRGMKVELAVTMLIAAAGVVSQMRLWRVIKEKKEEREEAKQQGRRRVEIEESKVGRQVEFMNRREKRRWERIYGMVGKRPSVESGLGNMASQSEVKVVIPGIVVTSLDEKMAFDGTHHEVHEEMVDIPLDDVVETAPQPPRLSQHPIFSKSSDDGRVTIRVASDEQPIPQESKIWVIGSDGEARLVSEDGVSSRTFSPPPEVVPLPFKVPTANSSDTGEDRSSALACVEEEFEPPSRRGSKRDSLANRLSVGSANIMRSLSQRSKTNTVGSYDEAYGESREELVESRQSRRCDDASSLAAHIDDLSSDDGRDFSDEEAYEQSPDDPSTPGKQKEIAKRRSEERSTHDWLTPKKSGTRPCMTAATEAVTTLPMSVTEIPCPGPSDLDETAGESHGGVTGEVMADDHASAHKSDETSNMANSHMSTESSQPVVLKSKHLPRLLSRVALSYRTNEWAKHLSDAEAPDLQDSQDHDHNAQPIVERPAPVDVEELQKTADNAPRPAAVSRTASAMSNQHYHRTSLPSMSRNVSTASLIQSQRNISPPGPNIPPLVQKNKFRRTSAQLLAHPIAEEGDVRGYSSPASPVSGESLFQGASSHSATSSPIIPNQGFPSASTPNLLKPPSVPGIVSYSSPQTLMGQREMLLRNKSQPSFYGAGPGLASNSNLPTIHSRPSSEAGSVRNFPGLGTDPSTSTNSLGHAGNLDDLPLSQRREILRQASLNLLEGNPARTSPVIQPRRATTQPYIPSAVQQSQLANFRSTVQLDLVNGAGFAAPYGTNANPSRVSIGGREVDVRRAVERQGSMLMLQKEAEARAKEQQRIQKLRAEREFDERMRRGELLGAHREAMRRLQGGVKDL